MKMKRQLLACALAVGLGSASWAVAPTDAGIQPHAQVQVMITRYCLSAEQGACGPVGIPKINRAIFVLTGTNNGFRFLRTMVQVA